ncbi:hypothetical protein RKD49_007826 [Streptomyces glaucescens]
MRRNYRYSTNQVAAQLAHIEAAVHPSEPTGS